MKEKIKENNTIKNKIQAKDIIIIIISLILLISTEISGSIGYSLGGIIAMLPTWIIEVLIATSVIRAFLRRRKGWRSCLPWGLLFVACFHFLIYLFEVYVASQISITF